MSNELELTPEEITEQERLAALQVRLDAIDISLALCQIIDNMQFDPEVDSYSLDAFKLSNLENLNCGLWRMPSPKPTLEDLEAAYAVIKPIVDQATINNEAEEYLRSTDWYVIRQMDSGEECPQEIKDLRQQARNRIIR